MLLITWLVSFGDLEFKVSFPLSLIKAQPICVKAMAYCAR